MTNTKHYDENYFTWQKKIGLFGAKANKIKFERYVIKGQRVLDFGCGSGLVGIAAAKAGASSVLCCDTILSR